MDDRERVVDAVRARQGQFKLTDRDPLLITSADRELARRLFGAPDPDPGVEERLMGWRLVTDEAQPPLLPEPEPTLHYHEDWEGFTGPVSDAVRVDGDLVVTVLHDSDNPPEPSPCAHQWLLLPEKFGSSFAWCPECGETREAP